MVFWIISGLVIFVYVAMICLFVVGWGSIKSFVPNKPIKTTFVSVVVAVRNEEKNINFLLQKLLCQDIPAEFFEIIIVDDHSTDHTAMIVDEFVKSNTCIRYFSLNDKEQGKKKAVEAGVLQAKGNLLITTDADCSMGEKWLRTIVTYYELHKPKMIIGPVAFELEKGMFKAMQSVEFMGLVASGAGAAGLNRPILCNAANLAFERESYLRVKGELKRGGASGDDVMFMLELKKSGNKDIHFLKSREAIVYTKTEESLKSLVNQRKRWVSKSRSYRDFDIVIAAIGVFLMNLLFAISLILMPLGEEYYYLATVIYLLKCAVDMTLLLPFSFFVKKQKFIAYIFLLQFLNIPYSLFLAIAGNLTAFDWKGRKYSPGKI